MREQKLSELKVELKLFKILLSNYGLLNEPVSSFTENFHLNGKENIISYILDGNNGYELSRYGHRNEQISAYNGKGYYQGQKCTVGASHSR